MSSEISLEEIIGSIIDVVRSSGLEPESVGVTLLVSKDTIAELSGRYSVQQQRMIRVSDGNAWSITLLSTIGTDDLPGKDAPWITPHPRAD